MARPPDEDAQRTALGAALLEARLRSGRSQAEVARKVGISKASVSNYERGLYKPSLSIAARLAESLGVDLVPPDALATVARSFVWWLRGQRNRRDDVGAVAQIVTHFTCLASHDYEGVRRHLEREHHAGQKILAALRVANDEYQRGEVE